MTAVATPGAGRMDRAYAAVGGVARFRLVFFFKRLGVHRPERVPARGAVLLCINHPNNFIDSMVVSTDVRRKVHYLATAALLRTPLLARFLLAMVATPVSRRQDDPAKMDKNVQAFAACFDTLADGRVVAIYP